LKLKKRKDNSKKGDNGKVLVIAGSLDYTGSAYLCSKAIATLRCGCDIVYVACPEKVAWALNSMSPDLITIKLKGDYLNLSHFEILKKTAKKCDVILIGPGISQKPQTKKLILKMIKEIIKLQKPIVIDADALKMIKLQDVENSILTPHQKEFEILIKNSKLNENNFREEIKNNIILKKGKIDYIYSKNKTVLVSGGNCGMTIGGTGDVLAGLCAGFISQGNNLFTSAYLASKINKKIGDKLNKKIGIGFIASDFLTEISKEANKYR